MGFTGVIAYPTYGGYNPIYSWIRGPPCCETSILFFFTMDAPWVPPVMGLRFGAPQNGGFFFYHQTPRLFWELKFDVCILLH